MYFTNRHATLPFQYNPLDANLQTPGLFGDVYQCTVVDRVMKSKLSHIPHNQYYPRVNTIKGY